MMVIADLFIGVDDIPVYLGFDGLDCAYRALGAQE